METLALDRQASNLAWCISCGLRAGYNPQEVFDQLAELAPEPSASACRQAVEALEKGQSLQAALESWKTEPPGGALGRMARVLVEADLAGSNLAEGLEALEQDLLLEFGSDPAFYQVMREEAAQLGAALPVRAA